MNRRQALTKAIQALASVPVLGWCVGETAYVPHKSFVTLNPPLPKIGEPYGTMNCEVTSRTIRQVGPNRYEVTLHWKIGNTPMNPLVMKYKAV